MFVWIVLPMWIVSPMCVCSHGMPTFVDWHMRSCALSACSPSSADCSLCLRNLITCCKPHIARCLVLIRKRLLAAVWPMTRGAQVTCSHWSPGVCGGMPTSCAYLCWLLTVWCAHSACTPRVYTTFHFIELCVIAIYGQVGQNCEINRWLIDGPTKYLHLS